MNIICGCLATPATSAGSKARLERIPDQWLESISRAANTLCVWVVVVIYETL